MTVDPHYERLSSFLKRVSAREKELRERITRLCVSPLDRIVSFFRRKDITILLGGYLILALLAYYLSHSIPVALLGPLFLLFGWLLIAGALFSSGDEEGLMLLVGLALVLVFSYVSGGRTAGGATAIGFASLLLILVHSLVDSKHSECGVECIVKKCDRPEARDLYREYVAVSGLASILYALESIVQAVRYGQGHRMAEEKLEELPRRIEEIDMNNIKIISGDPYARRLTGSYVLRLLDAISRSESTDPDNSPLRKLYDELREEDPRPDFISDCAGLAIRNMRVRSEPWWRRYSSFP